MGKHFKECKALYRGITCFELAQTSKAALKLREVRAPAAGPAATRGQRAPGGPRGREGQERDGPVSRV